MFLRKWMVAIVVVCVVVVFSGCGNASTGDAGSTSSQENKVSDQPVTLKVFQISAALTDKEFEDYFIQPVKKKYPNITLELVRNGDSKIADLVAAGTTPDIIYSPQAGLQQFSDLGLQYNLNDLISKNKFDIGKFDPVTVEGIKGYSTKGELFALPFSVNSSALFYNKDMFDKFGVPYPKDKMMWDQVIELGKKLARQDGGVQYKALYPSSFQQLSQQLSVRYTDPITDELLLGSEAWRKAASLYKSIYEIPGNEGAELADFFGKRVLAMYAGVANYTIGEAQKALDSGNPLNWDMVSYPNLPDTVGKSMELAAQIVLITSTSKNKDQAFQVLSIVTDKDNQVTMSRSGRLPALKDKAVREAFGQDIPALKGKNLQAFFLNTPPLPRVEKYESVINKVINNEVKNLVNGEDVNTFLRKITEGGQKAVNEEKAAQGAK
jgi:multiple sugar transport system substrate-binding protein